MSVGMSGILHTKSSYFGAAASYAEGGMGRAELFSDANIRADLNSALDYALQQERTFYQLYTDASDYDSFMAEIRKIFAGAGHDAQYIHSLGNTNLSAYIPEGWNQDSIGQATVVIDLECVPSEIDLSSLKLSLQNLSTSVEPNKLYITVSKNSAEVLKQAIGKILLDATEMEAPPFTVKRGNSKKEADFRLPSWKATSKNKKALHNWINDIVKNKKNTLLQKVGLDFEITEGKVTIEDLDEVIVPFTQYTKLGTKRSGSIQKALKDPETKAALERALAAVKNFIMNDCLHVSNGFNYPDKGNILEKSANYVWNSVEEKIMSGIEGFFFEGVNLSKGLLGAGGEFQVKLISTYVSMVTGNGALSQIIGGIIEDNRAEPRSDVQIIKELGGDIGTFIAGIQVKNVNEDTQTHLSISSDLELIAPNLPGAFRDTLANSMFNTDIKAMVGDVEALLKKYVETYFWRAMNLNVHADLNPSHTNTFYFVSGTHLVPASEIIQNMVARASAGVSEPQFTIKGIQNPSMGDEDFAERHGIDRKPTFIDYWDPIRYLGFGEGSVLGVNTANVSLYNSLLAGVSINTEFNINAVISSMNDKGSFTEIFPH